MFPRCLHCDLLRLRLLGNLRRERLLVRPLIDFFLLLQFLPGPHRAIRMGEKGGQRTLLLVARRCPPRTPNNKHQAQNEIRLHRFPAYLHDRRRAKPKPTYLARAVGSRYAPIINSHLINARRITSASRVDLRRSSSNFRGAFIEDNLNYNHETSLSIFGREFRRRSHLDRVNPIRCRSSS